MARRALLIGAQAYGLAGVTHDVEAMAALLHDRGYEIHRCEGEEATREGILAAYEAMINAAEPADASFLYYSGHGAAVQLAGGNAAATPSVQAIVPVDYHESTENDYRGITTPELSIYLKRLTDRTRNVTVVLDCCHAAHMIRDPDLFPKVTSPKYVDVAAHLAKLGDIASWRARPDVVQNPDAVRIVACDPWQSAYEHTNDDGDRAGVLTGAFTEIVRRAGDLPLSWSTVAARIRERITARTLGQNPSVEGPSRRLLFRLDEADPAGALPVSPLADGRARLPGGRLLGVEAGDEFSLMPPDAAAVAEDKLLGTARVEAVGSVTAHASVALWPGVTEIPLGALAYPRRATARTQPVDLCGDGAFAEKLAAAVTEAPWLRLADAGEVAPLAVVVEGEEATVRDPSGEILRMTSATEGAVLDVKTALVRLGRAAALRSLQAGDDALPDSVTISWGKVVDGAAHELRQAGDVLQTGDSLYVSLRNDSDRPLYFFVFDIGLLGQISLVTSADQYGLRVMPSAEHVVGRRDFGGGLEGLSVGWPSGLPADGARSESLLVLVTSAQQDMTFLEQDGVPIRAVSRGYGDSPFEDLQSELLTGRARDVQTPRPPQRIAYQAWRIDFDLMPATVPATDTRGE